MPADPFTEEPAAMVQLCHGPFQLELRPDLGGSVAAFRGHGVDLLHNDPGDAPPATPALGMAAFPLLPFCGRIAGGRFRSEDRLVVLPANMPGEPHAIHGQAWQQQWQVDDATARAAMLSYQHAADAWPWAYAARQCFRLDASGLTLDLALTNLGPGPMPAGLGWHPYFPRAGATLSADVGAIWPSGSAMIPDGPRALDGRSDLRRPRAVDALDLDDAFSSGPAGARLQWPDRCLTIRGDDTLGFLVVFTPPGRETFCVEPISHVPDAVNSPLPPARSGLRALDVDATLRARVALRVDFAAVTGAAAGVDA